MDTARVDAPGGQAARRRRRSIGRAAAVLAGALIALFLVGRGIAEFFVVDYSDPASYRADWGGPSLAGVFAVHSGPGLAAFVAALVRLRRRWRRPVRGSAAGTAVRRPCG